MTSCAKCQTPLVLQINIDSDEVGEGPSTQASNIQEVPDDVELSCGCHFHWQCLLDAYEVTKCPYCERDISSTSPTGETEVLCVLQNEGGAQHGLDVLPILSEELYLKAYPDDRKPRAFLEFCREGDIEAIIDLLKAMEDGDEESDEGAEDENEDAEMEDETSDIDVSTILRYQDPIGDMHSALHVAVTNGRTEVIYLLLLLASTLEEQHFPDEVKQAAMQLGISREDQTGKIDIRALTNSEGRIAAQYASHSTGIDPALLEP